MNEHFTVDGMLIEAWAGHKSFKPKDDKAKRSDDDDPGNPSVDFRGQRRRNATYHSTTDPEARLALKGAAKEAKPSYAGHVLIENREGLAVGACVNQVEGRPPGSRATSDVGLLAVRELDERFGVPGTHRTALD